ncbi:MAG: SRPBCC family protein [Vulcanimicrobiaceae bacterium]|jgi:uncharacterized protein YndB with AHSA1/START domain
MSTDRIEKTVVLQAPLERVWHAISDAREFGTWFGMALDGPFVAGTRLIGTIAPTQVDPAVAATQAPFTGTPVVLDVEAVEPMRRFAYRWSPDIGDGGATHMATTLVTFELEPVDGGTRLTITESGFDAIPLERRATVFAGNDAGWTAQTGLIAKYLTFAPR